MNIKITKNNITTYIFNVTKIEIFTSKEPEDPTNYYPSPSDPIKTSEKLIIFSVTEPKGYEVSDPEAIRQMKQMLSDADSEFQTLRF